MDEYIKQPKNRQAKISLEACLLLMKMAFIIGGALTHQAYKEYERYGGDESTCGQ